MDYTITILEELPFDELNDAERRYIEQLGTYRSEIGLNYQPGGNYFEPTDEIRKKMSDLKVKYLAEHPEANDAFAERIHRFWSLPENHEWFSQKLTEYWSREENRSRQSENTKRYFREHPEARARMSEFYKEYYSHKENLEHMRRRSQALWYDPEYRRKTLRAQKERNLAKRAAIANIPGQLSLDHFVQMDRSDTLFEFSFIPRIQLDAFYIKNGQD